MFPTDSVKVVKYRNIRNEIVYESALMVSITICNYTFSTNRTKKFLIRFSITESSSSVVSLEVIVFKLSTDDNDFVVEI